MVERKRKRLLAIGISKNWPRMRKASSSLFWLWLSLWPRGGEWFLFLWELSLVSQFGISRVLMGRVFLVELEGRSYRCRFCNNNVALADDVLSRVLSSLLLFPFFISPPNSPNSPIHPTIFFLQFPPATPLYLLLSNYWFRLICLVLETGLLV